MIADVVVLLEILLLSIWTGFILYLLVLTALALTVSLRHDFQAERERRFVVVIPAHNEEAGIRHTVQSIRAVSYPPERFSVLVVADNCTDRTADEARAAGATVAERVDPVERGKGYALRWAFDRILGDPGAPEAIVVIDADSEMSQNFLSVANWYLEHGARVVQASDLVAPDPEAWSAQMTRIGFYLYNYVRPLGRNRLGGTAGLRGNGMCFSADVLKENRWSAFSISEDLEYGLQLLLRGVMVKLAPEARVLALMPKDSRHAISQRSRWEGGRLPLIRRYAGPLLGRALRRGSLAHLDGFLDLITPALVNLIASAGILSLASFLLALGGFTSGVIYGFLWALVVLLGFLHLFAGLKIAGADSTVYAALLHLPRYAAWKLAVYARMPFRWTSTAWVRTAREGTSGTKTPPEDGSSPD
jgi:1,2-diacylglycerol 3-beta-glucosyltransferase